jgi:hypothetical protein
VAGPSRKVEEDESETVCEETLREVQNRQAARGGARYLLQSQAQAAPGLGVRQQEEVYYGTYCGG